MRKSDLPYLWTARARPNLRQRARNVSEAKRRKGKTLEGRRSGGSDGHPLSAHPASGGGTLSECREDTSGES